VVLAAPATPVAPRVPAIAARAMSAARARLGMRVLIEETMRRFGGRTGVEREKSCPELSLTAVAETLLPEGADHSTPPAGSRCLSSTMRCET